MKHQFVDWGISGTPNGRQQRAWSGVLAEEFLTSFDLNNTIGSCLPSPSHSTLEHPLFCLFYEEEPQILGLAHYISVYDAAHEKGSTSYCGSFVGFTQNQLPIGQGENLYRLLLNLTKQHLSAAVDYSTVAYKNNVDLKQLSLQEPTEILQILDESLSTPSFNFNYFPNFNQPLVIHYKQEKIPQLINKLISSELFRCFTKVYFTSSIEVVRKAQENGFLCWNAETVDSSCWTISSITTTISENWKKHLEYKHTQWQQQKQELAAHYENKYTVLESQLDRAQEQIVHLQQELEQQSLHMKRMERSYSQELTQAQEQQVYHQSQQEEPETVVVATPIQKEVKLVDKPKSKSWVNLALIVCGWIAFFCVVFILTFWILL